MIELVCKTFMPIQTLDLQRVSHFTKVRFASFFSGGFITVIVLVNPMEKKLVKRTTEHLRDSYVQCTYIVVKNYIFFIVGHLGSNLQQTDSESTIATSKASSELLGKLITVLSKVISRRSIYHRHFYLPEEDLQVQNGHGVVSSLVLCL